MINSFFKFVAALALFVIAGATAYSQDVTTEMVEGKIVTSENRPVADGIYVVTLSVPGTETAFSTRVETFDGVFNGILDFPADAATVAWSVSTMEGEKVASSVAITKLSAPAAGEMSENDFAGFAYQYGISGVHTPSSLTTVSAGSDEATPAATIPAVEPRVGAYSQLQVVPTSTPAN